LRQVPDVAGLPADQARLACEQAGFQVAVRRTGPPWPVRAGGGRDDIVLCAHLAAPDQIELLTASPSPERAPRVIPKHLAIICDGNGRWAAARGLPRHEGHRAGVENVRRVVEWCAELGMEHLSLYAFSTENWRRPKDEVDLLMGLIVEGAKAGFERLASSGIRIRVLGHLSALPGHVRDIIDRVVAATAQGGGLTVNLLLNYGGRSDIVEACRRIAADAAAGRLSPGDVSEAAVSARLLTAGTPDPDLIIRTAGDLRISNFLLWQSAYSELHFTPVCWPAFRRGDLLAAIDDFSMRQRRFGGLIPEGE
jgi:undecaprenyl diphosphate synthase